MLGRGPPEDILAAIVVGDERMLQTKPIRNRANARPFESPFGELRNGSVEDRAPRFKRALLFGSFARTSPPLRGHFHLCALRHIHWLTQLQGRRQGRHALTTTAPNFITGCCFVATPQYDPACPLFILEVRRTGPVVRGDEARRPSTPGAQLPGKPESIFDGVDARFHLGTNNERRLNAKNRIAL